MSADHPTGDPRNGDRRPGAPHSARDAGATDPHAGRMGEPSPSRPPVEPATAMSPPADPSHRAIAGEADGAPRRRVGSDAAREGPSEQPWHARGAALAAGLEPARTREVVRGAVLSDLAPVRPLAPPGRRALALLPVGVLLLALQPLYWGLRHDAAVLGWMRLWGISAGQSLLGVVMVGAALREAVPGRRLPRAPMWLIVGVLASIVATFVTWQGSATVVPHGRMGRYWVICVSRPMLMGAPVLAAILALAWRAYPLRAALVGALAGLGAGLMTDAGWRTYCHVSDPAHVLTAHLAAILALALAGAVSAAFLARLRE